jgi:hypothetical protein
MTTIVAQATGNWSAGATWTGGVKPGAGDIAQTGNYTVTIDENVTCSQLNSTGSGYFLVSAAGITITADIVTTGTNHCLQVNNATGTTTVNGNVTGNNQATTSKYGIYASGAGLLQVNGNLTGGSAGTSNVAMYVSAGHTVNVTGNTTGGSGLSAHGIVLNGSCTLNLTGNAYGGARNSAHGVSVTNSATLNMTGDATGSSTNQASGVQVAGGGTATIDGVATGGTPASSYGAQCDVNSTVYIKRGKAASGTGPGVYSATTGVTVKELEFGPAGETPILGAFKMLLDATLNKIIVQGSDSAAHTLSLDYPVVANVKKDVVYDLGQLVGTYVPGGAVGQIVRGWQTGFAFRRNAPKVGGF